MSRDTQFQGFAKLLWDELLGEYRYIDVSTGWLSELDSEDDEHKRYITLIAQRAYDLVQHTLLNVEHINLDRLDYEEHTARIPDMTTWPERGDTC